MVYQASPIRTSMQAFGKVRKGERCRNAVHSGKRKFDANTGKIAFDHERSERPNYGKATGMNASQWWANIINSTFSAVLPKSTPVPETLVAALIHRFSSKEGYRLYDDVIPCFQLLESWRNGTMTASHGQSTLPRVHIGVITNSDARVSVILTSLGIRTNSRRYSSNTTVNSTSTFDIDSVTLSYDVGFEKPNKNIFDAAKSLNPFNAESDSSYLHVGNSLGSDYYGAQKAGWRSVLLDRDSRYEGIEPNVDRVGDLVSLMQKLTKEY
ncbi:MAG: hypothetical protein Q9173_004678 [Seirophora scorigena]